MPLKLAATRDVSSATFIVVSINRRVRSRKTLDSLVKSVVSATRKETSPNRRVKWSLRKQKDDSEEVAEDCSGNLHLGCLSFSLLDNNNA
jgi:hypothetical protein